MEFSKFFFDGASQISNLIDHEMVDKLAQSIAKIRDNNGRLFILGVGGSAGNASHAVNDFRKLCNVQAYAPTDNVSELTARVNDEGWETIFAGWLKCSNLTEKDALLIFSVGGGNAEKNVSMNLVKAIEFAKSKNVKVFSIVGKNDGFAYKESNIKIWIPLINQDLVTPYSEAFQAVVWHCLVSHPYLKKNATKW
tara:strand:+ start:3533 stop:4117 length:585 start_codon:yes stop_codon:yes gene_type:complete